MRPLLSTGITNASAVFSIGLATATAIIGAIVAFVKLPSDRSNAAIAQAQGANEALSEALEAVERERDYWRSRFLECQQEMREKRS